MSRERGRCKPPLGHPEAHWKTIHASFNRTGGGPNLIALAALDVGLWDLYANRAGTSLSVAMGGDGGPVPIYGSGDFSPAMSPAEAAEIAVAHRETGFRGVKPRVNAQPTDAAVMQAVRAAVGDAHGGLVRLAPGEVFPMHKHVGEEKVLLIQGTLEDDNGTLQAGEYGGWLGVTAA